jgi:hypothetical protein
MALLQALLAFFGRSAGKILYAAFGWAVRALFGYTTGARRMLLTGLVALAALWPLLVAGVAFPRVAAFAVAFVPISGGVDATGLRLAWVAAALFVPALVGIALATQTRTNVRRESAWRRVARGYPVTLGLAIAFWISFVSVPLVRIAAAAHGLRDAYVPLVTSARGYRDAAERVRLALDAHGFALREAEPGLWTRLPLDVLRKLGGAALRDFVPERLAWFEGKELVAALFPTGLLLRGAERRTAQAHGLAVEALTRSDALQTTGAEAQRLEGEIRRVWQIFDEAPAAHRGSPRLLGRAGEIARDLTRADVPYDDWQIVYREILQLVRAVRGEPQLLDAIEPQKRRGDMAMASERARHERAAAALSTAQLLRQVTAKSALLVRREVDLAREELRADMAAELATAKALAIAAALALTTLDLLLVAVVFAFVPLIEGWLAALLVAGATLLVAVVVGMVGWSRRVRRPLERTRRTLEEDVRWAKERLA